MNIIEAIEHPHLFAPLFRSASWEPWKSALRAMFGLDMSQTDVELFTQCTGRVTPPTKPFKEAWFVCGRRAGKSFVMSLTACFLATFFDYRPYLNVGERATIMIIAADRKQARVCMRYMRGMFAIPALAKLVDAERAESFDLNNRVTIEVHTASFSPTRGYSVAAVIFDEIAFAETAVDSSVPAKEIIRALRPAMAMIPTSMLLCASSPWSRTGVLWETYSKHYGKDESSTLVWRAPTTTMNPLFPQALVDAAIEEDHEAAKTEYLAEFRNDIGSYVDRDVVENSVLRGAHEIPYMPGQQFYAMVEGTRTRFVSASPRAGITLAFAHRNWSVFASIARLSLPQKSYAKSA